MFEYFLFVVFFGILFIFLTCALTWFVSSGVRRIFIIFSFLFLVFFFFQLGYNKLGKSSIWKEDYFLVFPQIDGVEHTKSSPVPSLLKFKNSSDNVLDHVLMSQIFL